MASFICAPASWKEAGQAVIQFLFVKPIRGFGEILSGLALAGPELIQAAASAAVEAVRKHLGADGQVKVRQGMAQVLAGAQGLAAPTAVAVLIWICWNPSVLYLASAAWVLVFAMCLAVD